MNVDSTYFYIEVSLNFDFSFERELDYIFKSPLILAKEIMFSNNKFYSKLKQGNILM
jgi:hypothetical protein